MCCASKNNHRSGFLSWRSRWRASIFPQRPSKWYWCRPKLAPPVCRVCRKCCSRLCLGVLLSLCSTQEKLFFCSAWKLWATAATGHLHILGTFVAKTQRHKQIQREHVRTAFLRSDFFQDLSSTCLPRPPVQMMLKLRQLRSTSLSCPSMPTVWTVGCIINNKRMHDTFWRQSSTQSSCRCILTSQNRSATKTQCWAFFLLDDSVSI